MTRDYFFEMEIPRIQRIYKKKFNSEISENEILNAISDLDDQITERHFHYKNSGDPLTGRSGHGM